MGYLPELVFTVIWERGCQCCVEEEDEEGGVGREKNSDIEERTREIERK
jgi:hypothetical protein